jgi:hypothetical protein
MILKSRKFWLMVVDVVISLTGVLLGWYLAPESAERIMTIIAILQPVVISLIVGIAVEDAAEKRATVYQILDKPDEE